MRRGDDGPRRVLMTADAVGGVWHYAMDLCAGLSRAGIEIVVAVMGPEPSAAQRATAAAIPGLRLCVRRYRLEWMESAENDLREARHWLADLQANFDPDVLHFNGYALASWGWDAPVVIVCHSCVRSWWRAVHRSDVPPHWDGYTHRVRQGLRAADLVIAPTRAFLAQVRSLYDELPDTMVIHNARTGPFQPRRSKEAFVLSCGRAWDVAKGGPALDVLAGRLASPVYLAGDVSSPTGAGAFKIEHLRLLGRLEEPELAKWLGRASIFALPARYEPFGLSVLEAAKSGCALILGDIETLRELWDGAAIFVDPRDDEALFDAATRLINNPGFCRAMGVRALRRAQNYSVERMIDAYVQAYRHVRILHNFATQMSPDTTQAMAAGGWQ